MKKKRTYTHRIKLKILFIFRDSSDHTINEDNKMKRKVNKTMMDASLIFRLVYMKEFPLMFILNRQISENRKYTLKWQIPVT